MRIIHSIPVLRLDRGGPVRAALDLCQLLTDAGHDVTIWTNDPTDTPPRWDGRHPEHPSVVDLGPLAVRNQLLRPRQLRLVRELIEPIHAVHLHGMWELCNAQIATIARDVGVAYFLSPHGMLDTDCMNHRAWKKRLHMRIIGNAMLRGTRRIHLTARLELEQSQAHFDPRKGVVIPFPIDARGFENLPGPAEALARFPQLASAKHRLMFLGRLHPIKGIERLLRAAASIIAEGTDLLVVLTGPGEESYIQELRTLAAELRIAERVLMTGPASGSLKLSLLQSSAAMVLPSYHENQGMVLLEALATGTPIITTNGVKIWQELQASGAAKITDGDPANMAQAAREYLLDEASRAIAGAKGRDWVMKFVEPDEIRAKFHAMYAADPIGDGSTRR